MLNLLVTELDFTIQVSIHFSNSKDLRGLSTSTGEHCLQRPRNATCYRLADYRWQHQSDQER